ncbi:MAG: anti-sigma factor family protein [Frankiaceae bacterium]
MTCTDVRLALGAYVLGALDPAERSSVQAHVDRCPACRDELAELAGLPGLLANLTREEVEAGAAKPSPALLDGLLATVAAESVRERTKVRHRRWLAAAATVAVLAGGGASAAVALHHDQPRGIVALSAVDPRTHVSADVRLRPLAWGTEISLRRLTGVPAGERCRLVAVATDGHRESAGAWGATSYLDAALITGAASIQLADLSRLDIVTFSGRTLLSVRVPAAAGAAGNADPAGTATSWG